MKIGILVNTDKHLGHILGLVNAALSRGHDIAMFVMDTGTKLLENPAFFGICLLPGVSMSFCELSARQAGIEKADLPAAIRRGSQYDNAVMEHESDKILVF